MGAHVQGMTFVSVCNRTSGSETPSSRNVRITLVALAALMVIGGGVALWQAPSLALYSLPVSWALIFTGAYVGLSAFCLKRVLLNFANPADTAVAVPIPQALSTAPRPVAAFTPLPPEFSLELDGWVASVTGTEKEARLVAKGRIQHCMTAQTPILSLSKLGLSSLPNAIRFLTHLEKLDCSENNITTIPYQIASLTKLQSLILTKNQIGVIPPELCTLTELTSLVLIHNQIRDIPPEICQLDKLKKLGLNHNRVADIPAAVGQLLSLELLGLEQNNISVFSSELCNLRNLQKLWLGHNQIEEIPKEVCQLINLQLLSLKGNKISIVPRELFQLPQLQKLWLSQNRIAEIPREVGELTGLTTLFLGQNGIGDIPREICVLENLREFEVCQNQLRAIPAEIGRLNSLEEFDASQNQIRAIPYELYQMRNLQVLWLKGNNIREIPRGVSQLESLKLFELSENQIRDIPPEMGSLPSLEGLGLSQNEIDEIPVELCRSGSLQRLLLVQNRVVSLPEEIFELSRNCTVVVRNNSFPRAALVRLEERVRGSGYTGPEIEYTSLESFDRREKPLEELLAELSRNAEMEALAVPNLQAYENDLKDWLSRLVDVGEYRGSSQKSLAVLIYTALLTADREDSFRDVFLTCIQGATTTCGDRMALSILHLGINLKIRQCENLKELLLLLGHGVMALDELQKLAQIKERTLTVVDAVEVYLAYPVKLKDRLKLQIDVESMLYFECSQVTSTDLDAAEAHVKGLLSNQDAYANFLLEQDAWLRELGKSSETKDRYLEIETAKAHAMEADAPDYVAIEKRFKTDVKVLTQEVLRRYPPPFILLSGGAGR